MTKNIISDEIADRHQEKIRSLEQKKAETQLASKELGARIRQENIHIMDTYGPYLGKEFLQAERLNELSRLIQDGSASNLTEAMEMYRGQGEK